MTLLHKDCQRVSDILHSGKGDNSFSTVRRLLHCHTFQRATPELCRLRSAKYKVILATMQILLCSHNISIL